MNYLYPVCPCCQGYGEHYSSCKEKESPNPIDLRVIGQLDMVQDSPPRNDDAKLAECQRLIQLQAAYQEAIFFSAFDAVTVRAQKAMRWIASAR